MRYFFLLSTFIGLLLGSSHSTALTLSEPTLHSQLGNPLEITIELKNLGDLNIEDLLVDLAPEEYYQEMTISLKSFHHDLRFALINTPNNKTALKISSHKPINEPYLDFLVLIRWPNGKLIKEVTVLFDAPGL